MLKQSASGGWSEERSRCIWSSERRQHEEVTRKSAARLLKKAQKNIISLFSFSFPLNRKMPQKSPLTLACVWQIRLWHGRSQRVLWGFSCQHLPRCPIYTLTHTRYGNSIWNSSIQARLKRAWTISLQIRFFFSSVPLTQRGRADRIYNRFWSSFFSRIIPSLWIIWCNQANLPQNISSSDLLMPPSSLSGAVFMQREALFLLFKVY